MKKWIGLTTALLMAIVFMGGCKMSQEATYNEVDSQINEDLFYENPLGISQIGDPFILKASDGNYYCYATSDTTYGFEVWTSTNLVDWEKHNQRAYSSNKNSFGVDDFWAPEVYEWDGQYYMYYSARWRENDSLRIGLGISDSPLGPFEDISEAPLFDFGYAVIDAHVFVDGEENYLYYTRDCSEYKVGLNNESHSYGIRLSADYKSVVGEPVLLVQPEQAWEKQSGTWRWNEGPFVVKHDSMYYLTYSANFYASKEYSVGYAQSSSPLGPFTKSEQNPLLYAKEEQKKVSGSGHNMMLKVPNSDLYYMVYHTHTVPSFGGGDRTLNIDIMGFREDGSVFVNGPSILRQLKPDVFEGALKLQGNYAIFKNDEAIQSLSDHEIAVDESQFELAPVESLGSDDVVEIRFEAKSTVESLMIYSGYINDEVMTLDIIFSNGNKISDLSALDKDKTLVIAGFEPAEVEWIKIYNKGKKIDLSEIIVVPSK